MKVSTSKSRFNFMPLFLFAVAMGFLEAIVVVYVREIYYPEGFRFPLQLLEPKIVTVELIRELCTLLMLGSVAWISRKIFIRRFSVFLFLFGVWDIIYYVGLKLFLDWPESWLTWDILFLIPITWLGPVLAPVICSMVMIAMAFAMEYLVEKGNPAPVTWKKLLPIIIGAFIIYISFTLDFGLLLLKGNYLSDLATINQNPEFIKEMTSFVPTHFHWEIFIAGIVFIVFGNVLIIKDALRKSR